MYIINGIAYAGEPTPIIKVSTVKVIADYKLLVNFTNGEIKIFDFYPLLNMSCYQPLKDKTIFNAVYVDYGCTVWNDGEIDIAPETLFEQGISYNKKLA